MTPPSRTSQKRRSGPSPSLLFDRNGELLRKKVPSGGAGVKQVQLILIDSERLRREELKAYHASCQALDRETRKLKSYEEDEVPAFRSWLQSTFAEDLAKLAESTAVVRDFHHLIEDVERYVAWKGVSRRIALDVIESARLDGRYSSLWDELEKEEAAARAKVEAHEGFDDDDWDFGDFGPEFDPRDFFSAFFDDAHDNDRRQSGGRAGASSGRTHADAEDKPADDYIKSLYRKLVRALHPDANTGLPADKAQLWHEVQDAYTWRDVSRLERLYQRVVTSGDDIVNLQAAPIRDLRSLRRAIEANLKRLRRRTREAQRDIAWGFRKTLANATKLKNLRRDVGRDIAHDLAIVRMEREELETIVSRWRHPTTARERARSRSAQKQPQAKKSKSQRKRR